MALHSDHVNYLIFRYLQESGLEQTARSLAGEWQRPYDSHDPENLHFAPRVQRGELISVLQYGVWHDELRAQALVAKGTGRVRRQFQWVGTNPRRESTDAQMLENGASRPSSSGEKQQQQRRRSKARRAQAATAGTDMRAPDEFPTPPPKRARRSEGSEGAQLNGESMEVDTALSPSLADAEGEDDPDLASPVAAATPTEVIEVPERYDSMDVATQTEVKVGTKTSTMYWSVGKTGESILRNTWNPKDKNALLTVGESLCRMHWVKCEHEDGETGGVHEVTQEDLTDLPSNAVVTAATWHPDGHAATCAVDYAPQEGQPAVQQLLLERQMKSGITTVTPSTSMLEPAGIVIRMQYSPPNGEYLLVLRNNLKRGLVQIWDTGRQKHQSSSSEQDADAADEVSSTGDSSPNLPTTEPISYQLFDRQVLDACWLSSDTFVIVGEGGLASVHKLSLDDSNNRNAPLTPTSLTADTVLSLGLREVDGNLLSVRGSPGAESVTWSKVAADPLTGVIAIASSSSKPHRLVGVVGGASDDVSIGIFECAGSSPLTDFAFRPQRKGGPRAASLLAATFEDGTCDIYEHELVVPQRPGAKGEEIFYPRATLPPQATSGENEGVQGSALAIAWSPDGGSHLAVAGVDHVRIWNVMEIFQHWSELSPQQRTERMSESKPVVAWRFEPSAVAAGRRGDRDGEDEGSEENEQVMSEPSLSWSADGEKLGFSAGNVVAVITFRPRLSLQFDDDQADTSPDEEQDDRAQTDKEFPDQTAKANEESLGAVNGAIS